MKKILSVLLAVLLVASLGVTAFAAEEETVVLDDMGMTLTYPAEYSELKGVIFPYPWVRSHAIRTCTSWRFIILPCPRNSLMRS